jgi:hypothetical protein
MRHGAALIEMTKLAFPVFFVFGVEKYATVKQCSMHITHHGTDVAKSRAFPRKNARLGTMDVPANHRNERAN